MVIELYGQEFTVQGFPVIKGNSTHAYATDGQGNIYLLIWPAGKDPVKGNTQLVKLTP